MKGAIINFSKTNLRHIDIKDIKFFVKNFGVTTFLGIMLIIGMIYGAVTAKSANVSLLTNLDFLFITNFQLRISQGLFLTFAASLSSYFIFWFTEFLFGVSAWGFTLIPLILFIKGIGIGLSAGYLYSTYSFKGIYFYLLIMLIGAFISSVALIKEGREAFYFSKNFGVRLLPKNQNTKQLSIIKYLVNSGYSLMLTALAAVIDALAVMLFSGLFSF